MLLAPVMGKGSTCDETELGVAAAVAFVRIPCPSLTSPQIRTWGLSKPPLVGHHKTELLLHTDFEVQEWLPSLPDFRTHTQGSRMGLQENLPLQHQSSIAIGQHAERQVERWDWSSGAGSALRASRLQRDFQPCDKLQQNPPPPPFATIAAPHSFIDPGDPSRPDDARG
jgi:hypothetical protein